LSVAPRVSISATTDRCSRTNLPLTRFLAAGTARRAGPFWSRAQTPAGPMRRGAPRQAASGGAAVDHAQSMSQTILVVAEIAHAAPRSSGSSSLAQEPPIDKELVLFGPDHQVRGAERSHSGRGTEHLTLWSTSGKEFRLGARQGRQSSALQGGGSRRRFRREGLHVQARQVCCGLALEIRNRARASNAYAYFKFTHDGKAPPMSARWPSLRRAELHSFASITNRSLREIQLSDLTRRNSSGAPTVAGSPSCSTISSRLAAPR